LFAAQIESYEASQCRTVEQRVLAGFINKVKSRLNGIDAQLALKTRRPAPIAGL
jgi:hypothetical protein